MSTRLIRTACMSLTLCSLTVFAQPFEGTIEFTKTAGPVVTNYKYFVKGDNVRIEEVNDRGEIQGIMLVDTKERTVTALSPDRKLFMDVPNMRLPKDVDAKIEKTSESKKVAGIDCNKWLVRSNKENRTLTYWVAGDEFNFFIPLLETLNRKDEQAVFFLEMPGTEGMFPMAGIEMTNKGDEISRLEVTSVMRSNNYASLFEVPGDYTKFERN